MRSHTQSVVIELNRRRITGCISYKPLISDLSVFIVCNKTGGTIKGDIKKFPLLPRLNIGGAAHLLSLYALIARRGTKIPVTFYSN